MIKLHSLGAVLAIGLALAAVTAVTAPPAAAAERSALPAGGRATEHCAVEIATTASSAAASKPVCFSSRDRVEKYLDAVIAADLGARLIAAASSVAVGTVYKDINRGGSSLTFWGASGCSGATFGFASMPSGWSTSVSSATGTNGCWATLYTATSYGGTRLNCTPYCKSVGGLNDRVKSIVFRPTGTFG